MTLKETIEQQVVNDYFTPNIKAEVILDMLLTPYIPQILRTQCGIDAKFLTKEMSMEEPPKEVSMEEHSSEDDRGAKIDYVLEGDQNVYLVELKTTAGSIKKEQADRYLRLCRDENGKPQTFGKVFGDKLLRILNKRIEDIPRNRLGLKDAFEAVVGSCGRGQCAENAKRWLEANHRADTYKYLYTLGQILDKCSNLDTLWKKELQLIYITPNGEQPHEDLITAPCFYLCPQNSKKSVSLTDAVLSLEPGSDDGEYVQMLQSIISKICNKEESTP